MPTTTPCRSCGAIGFIRREHVIKSDTAHTQFYCGHCNKSWTEAEHEQRATPRVGKPAAADKPDWSRSEN